MVKFCSCGSLLVDEVCTNKNCSLQKAPAKKAVKPKTIKTTGASPVNTGAKATKSAYDMARRNSKCITYSLAELEKRENEKE